MIILEYCRKYLKENNFNDIDMKLHVSYISSRDNR